MVGTVWVQISRIDFDLGLQLWWRFGAVIVIFQEFLGKSRLFLFIPLKLIDSREKSN